jgi:regulator of replication initiation timing
LLSALVIFCKLFFILFHVFKGKIAHQVGIDNKVKEQVGDIIKENCDLKAQVGDIIKENCDLKAQVGDIIKENCDLKAQVNGMLIKQQQTDWENCNLKLQLDEMRAEMNRMHIIQQQQLQVPTFGQKPTDPQMHPHYQMQQQQHPRYQMQLQQHPRYQMQQQQHPHYQMQQQQPIVEPFMVLQQGAMSMPAQQPQQLNTVLASAGGFQQQAQKIIDQNKGGDPVQRQIPYQAGCTYYASQKPPQSQ